VKGLPEDILDHKTYGKLGMPVLALGGPGYGWLKAVLEPTVGKLKLVKMEGAATSSPRKSRPTPSPPSKPSWTDHSGAA
jgi:hypothetical protein